MSDEYENDAELALTHLAADLVGELTARQLALELAAARQELAEAGQIYGPGGFTPPRDPFGQWQPAPPGPQAGWHHTLRHAPNRQHLLGADPFMAQLYGREPGPGRYAAVAAHGQPAGGSGGTPAPVLPESELDARGMYEAARGIGGTGGDIPLQQPQQAAAMTQRPARRARRRSRMPQYRGRRR